MPPTVTKLKKSKNKVTVSISTVAKLLPRFIFATDKLTTKPKWMVCSQIFDSEGIISYLATRDGMIPGH